MEFLIGLGLSVLLLSFDWLFFMLIKKIDPKKSLLLVAGSFVIGMFLSLFYTILMIILIPMNTPLLYALGLELSVLISIIYKVSYTLLKL